MTYCKGNVYKIICSVDDNICYIGSTFNQVRHRFQEHKNSYRKWLKGKGQKLSLCPYFEKYGIENFKCILIKSYMVYREHKHDFKHLQSKEQLWISKTKCINKHNSFFIKRFYQLQEYQKEYRQNNRDKILEKQKENYKKNKNKILEKRKEYYEKNKSKILEYNKLRLYTCLSCNKTMIKSSKYNHEKSGKHIKNIQNTN